MKKLHRARDFLAGVLVTALVVSLSVPAMAALASKTIQVSTGVEIYVDGVKMDPTDVNGSPVETFIYNGTTYVPIRAVSQSLGKAVDWDGVNQRVYIGEIPGQKQYLLTVCPPYQTSGSYNTPATITMAGQKYANGCILGYDYLSGATAWFNLNGQYNTLQFDVGHIDGKSMGDSIFNIYLENELVFSVDLTGEMLPQHYTIPLYGALQMKFETTSNNTNPTWHYGGCYGIVNIEIK